MMNCTECRHEIPALCVFKIPMPFHSGFHRLFVKQFRCGVRTFFNHCFRLHFFPAVDKRNGLGQIRFHIPGISLFDDQVHDLLPGSGDLGNQLHISIGNFLHIRPVVFDGIQMRAHFRPHKMDIGIPPYGNIGRGGIPQCICQRGMSLGIIGAQFHHRANDMRFIGSK